MVRGIEHSEYVHMVITDAERLSVNTPAEVERVAELMMSNSPERNDQGV